MVTAEHRVVVLRRIADLQGELDMLRRSQDRLRDIARLQFVLGVHGLEVLDYDGPAFYELGHVAQCEVCGDLVDEDDKGYELFLRSRAWGPRYGYLHKECYDRTVSVDGSPSPGGMSSVELLGCEKSDAPDKEDADDSITGGQ